MAEWDLRAGTTSTSRVLMRRSHPAAAWQDVATFGSYNDAEWVLRLVRRGDDPDLLDMIEWNQRIGWTEMVDHAEKLRGLLVKAMDQCMLSSDALAQEITAELRGTGWVDDEEPSRG